MAVSDTLVLARTQQRTNINTGLDEGLGVAANSSNGGVQFKERRGLCTTR